nr:putative wd repeat-containing protein c17d11.08 [Quercus suber]
MRMTGVNGRSLVGNGAGKMAIGSYLEDPHNFIQILDTQIAPQELTSPGGVPYGLEYTKIAEATCAYPVTRILWEPPSSQKQSTDLLATSGDHLRLWSLPQASTQHSSNINRSSAANTREAAPQKLQPLALLSNSKTPEHTAPLTSLDWNTLSPKLIITSSIDTTCTIWDIPTLTAKTQLIAHDKEVFDVRFCAGSVDVFVSCGADGSVRMFDLRSLEHSTIIYEPAEKNDKSSPAKGQGQTVSPVPPLLRLAASPHDSHLLATFASDSNLIRILDVRQPGTALLELRGHQGNLNTIEWNPSRRGMLASGADDSMVLVWDLLNSSNQAAAPAPNAGGIPGQAGEVQGKGPSASWHCEYEVANLSWSPSSGLTNQGGDWLGVCAGRGVWGVKMYVDYNFDFRRLSRIFEHHTSNGQAIDREHVSFKRTIQQSNPDFPILFTGMTMVLEEPAYCFELPSLEDGTILNARIYHPASLPKGIQRSDRHGDLRLQGAVVAHPYAPLGGCYDDPVVLAITETLLNHGFVVATFNFRGSSDSPGRTSWTGQGEQDDYASIVGCLVHYLCNLSGVNDVEAANPIDLLLAGYSYGSLILARLPAPTVILTRFQHAVLGTPAAEIILRARTLATQTKTSLLLLQPRGRSADTAPPHATRRARASTVTVGGDESERPRQRRDSRRSGDFVRRSLEAPARLVAHVRRRSESRAPAALVSSPPPSSPPELRVWYLLVSPVVLPFTTALMPPGTPQFRRQAAAAQRGAGGRGEFLRNPTLAVFGTADAFTSRRRLSAWAERQASEAGDQGTFEWEQVEGAGHFWREKGEMQALREVVDRWVAKRRKRSRRDS